MNLRSVESAKLGGQVSTPCQEYQIDQQLQMLQYPINFNYLKFNFDHVEIIFGCYLN